MEEFKSILLALGAAFAIALGALLFALLMRKRAEAFQEELKLPPEILRKVEPPWRFWVPLLIVGGFVSIGWLRGGSMTSVDITGPLLVSLIVTGGFSFVYFLRQWQREPVESALRKRFRRNLAASVLQTALFAVLLWMNCLTR